MNVEESDLLLFPDAATLAILPWRPQQGRVIRFFCDIRYPDGSPFEGDCRHILRQANQKVLDAGMVCKIGPECEFYLFEADDRGNPTKIPQDHGSYFDVAPLDRGENVRREICLSLEEMGVQPEASHHEQGPGQNEVDFKHSDAVSAADNLVTFRSVVKAIAALNGLYASFLPKPLAGQSGNGLHINLSLSRGGLNIFKTDHTGHSQEAESFIAGVLHRAREMTLVLNPLPNSYQRFGSFEAPRFVTWSHQNRSQLIRIPAASGEYSRMELRSPDPSCNPYYAFALLLQAGMEGIEQGRKLCAPCNVDLYGAGAKALNDLERLPASLGEALELAKSSEFLKRALPGRTLSSFLALKQKQWEEYERASDKDALERAVYFVNV